MSNTTDVIFKPGMEIGYRSSASVRWQLARVVAVVEGHLHIRTSDPEGLTALNMADPDFWDQIGTPF